MTWKLISSFIFTSIGSKLAVYHRPSSSGVKIVSWLTTFSPFRRILILASNWFCCSVTILRDNAPKVLLVNETVDCVISSPLSTFIDRLYSNCAIVDVLVSWSGEFADLIKYFIRYRLTSGEVRSVVSIENIGWVVTKFLNKFGSIRLVTALYSSDVHQCPNIVLIE